MTPETMLRLAEHPNIIGVKECTTLANMAYLIEHKPEEFLVYTGEDGDAFHAMNLGADGVISVASHTNGDEMYEMFQAIEHNDIKKAAAIQRQFIPKVNALFSYPSPAPVKAVLKMEVIKRSGEVVEFNPDKIYQAILKAAQVVYVLTDDLRQNLAQVTKKVAMDLDEAQVERATISMIQSLVEQRLLGAGYITIAEHYISYRLQRDLERSGYGDHIAVHLHFEQIR